MIDPKLLRNDPEGVARNLARLGHAVSFQTRLPDHALGRGLEYYDVVTVEQIVRRLESGQGRFAELLAGIVESAPFQRTRRGTGDRAGN